MSFYLTPALCLSGSVVSLNDSLQVWKGFVVSPLAKTPVSLAFHVRGKDSLTRYSNDGFAANACGEWCL